jgi:hypothetical protein
MDEITMYTALRPQAPGNAGELTGAARQRLADEFGRPHRPGRRVLGPRVPGRRRLLLAAGAIAAAAAAAIVVPAVLPGGEAGSLVTAAWAVQDNPDGTVAVTFKQARDAAGLQRYLRAHDVPAYVRFIPFVRAPAGDYRRTQVCGQTGPGNLPGGQRNVTILEEVFPFLAAGGAPAGDALTIRPSRIPAGDSILIEVSWYPGDGRLGGNVGDGVLGNDNPPTCTPAR